MRQCVSHAKDEYVINNIYDISHNFLQCRRQNLEQRDKSCDKQ